MQKFTCYWTVFALFYFEFESNFQVLGRAIYQRVSCEFGGLTLIEGLIFRILHYLPVQKQVQTNCCLYYHFYEKAVIISHYKDKQGYWQDFNM